MITLEAHRAIIGAFYGTTQHRKGIKAFNCHTKRPNYFCSCEHPAYSSYEAIYIIRLFGLAMFLLITSCNMNLACLKLLELLQAGDIETNPGPFYNLIKTVKASYHQGHIKFGDSAGMQCACNCLFAICFNAVAKRVALWKMNDLNFILDQGDQIYKELNISGMLSIQELPTTINSGQNRLTVTMLHNETAILSEYNSCRFFAMLFQKYEIGDGMLFMSSGFTTGILWTKKNYFLFDPHCCDENGTISNDNSGTCVVLKFSSLQQLENYIYEIYFPFSTAGKLQYEVQFVTIEKDGDTSVCRNTLKTLKRKYDIGAIGPTAKRMAAFRKRIKNTPKHGEVKELHREGMSAYREKLRNTVKHNQMKELKRSNLLRQIFSKQ